MVSSRKHVERELAPFFKVFYCLKDFLKTNFNNNNILWDFETGESTCIIFYQQKHNDPPHHLPSPPLQRNLLRAHAHVANVTSTLFSCASPNGRRSGSGSVRILRFHFARAENGGHEGCVDRQRGGRHGWQVRVVFGVLCLMACAVGGEMIVLQF